jgi:O-antigen/teichoic acid export membrane protein
VEAADAPVARRLVSESVAYASIDVAQNVLALVVLPVSLFWLTTDDMGTVTLAVLGSQVVLTVASLGLDFAVIRFFLQWPESERPARLSGVFVITALWSIALTVAAGALWWQSRGDASAAALASVAAGTGLAVRAIPMAYFRVTSRLVPYGIVAVGGSAVQAALQIGLLQADRGHVGFLAGAALAAWVSATAACAMAWRMIGASPRTPDRSTMRMAALNLGSGVFNRLLAGADRLTVLAWTNVDTLGVYGTAARWTLPLRTISGGTKLALAPALSRGEASRSLDATASASVTFFVTTMALVSALLQLSSWFLLLTPWRPVLADLQRLLGLLLIAQICAALALMGQTALYYADRAWRSTATAMLTAVVTIGALVWLVPRHGATGAAIAQLLASLVSLGVMARLARDVAWTSPRVWGAVALAAIGSAVPWAAGAIVSVAVTAAAAVVLAWWSWHDLRAAGLSRWLSRST